MRNLNEKEKTRIELMDYRLNAEEISKELNLPLHLVEDYLDELETGGM
jgi:hypothetical protein